jgi:SRSO17 transposase
MSRSFWPAEGRVIEPPPLPLAPHFDADQIGRFSAFTDLFQSVFPRSDQFKRFQTYLRGLLLPGDRKNVEAMAERVAELMPGEDLAQALQHFVSESPWRADRLLAVYREVVGVSQADENAVWVVHDAAFPKKGRHSVGVQRQFARSLGRKVNCQVAVVLSQIGPLGFFPLTARLYLPSHWLRENRDQAEMTVPEEYRRGATKAAIALSLIDEVRSGTNWSFPITVVAEPTFATDIDFENGLASRCLDLLDGEDDFSIAALADCHRRLGWLRTNLGLDHFEGRSWSGWHHQLALVFTAYAFLATEQLLGPYPKQSLLERSSS